MDVTTIIPMDQVKFKNYDAVDDAMSRKAQEAKQTAPTTTEINNDANAPTPAPAAAAAPAPTTQPGNQPKQPSLYDQFQTITKSVDPTTAPRLT